MISKLADELRLSEAYVSTNDGETPSIVTEPVTVACRDWPVDV